MYVLAASIARRMPEGIRVTGIIAGPLRPAQSALADSVNDMYIGCRRM